MRLRSSRKASWGTSIPKATVAVLWPVKGTLSFLIYFYLQHWKDTSNALFKKHTAVFKTSSNIVHFCFAIRQVKKATLKVCLFRKILDSIIDPTQTSKIEKQAKHNARGETTAHSDTCFQVLTSVLFGLSASQMKTLSKSQMQFQLVLEHHFLQHQKHLLTNHIQHYHLFWLYSEATNTVQVASAKTWCWASITDLADKILFLAAEQIWSKPSVCIVGYI